MQLLFRRSEPLAAARYPDGSANNDSDEAPNGSQTAAHSHRRPIVGGIFSYWRSNGRIVRSDGDRRTSRLGRNQMEIGARAMTAPSLTNTCGSNAIRSLATLEVTWCAPCPESEHWWTRFQC